MPNAYRLPQDRRYPGIALTVLVHATLLLGWRVSRTMPPAAPDAAPQSIQWLRLPVPETVPVAPPAPAPRSSHASESARRAPVAAPVPATERTADPAAITAPVADAAATGVAPASASASASASAPASASDPSAPPAGMLQRALRDAGAVDKALRKENRPYIVAPLDSPQIRLRNGIGAAADLAPNKWYEAPKVAELVNNTGDGARRTRVVGSGRTYCVTERATNTSIDMIEKHGKLRITNCPEHETPASAQGWRTARD